MENLIRAEFYRIRCRPWGVIVMAATLLFGVVVILFAEAIRPPEWGNCTSMFEALSSLPIFGMFYGAWCAEIASSRVNKLDILKNEAVFGIPRWQMVLSRLSAATLIGCTMALMLVVSSVLLAFLFLPGKEALPQLAANLLVEFLVALPLWVACASLYLCLKLLFASDLVAVFVLFLYQFLLWPILGAWSLLNPNAWVMKLLCTLHLMTPFWGKGVDITETNLGLSVSVKNGFIMPSPLYCWALGLGWIVFTTVVSVWALRRRELR